VDGRLDANNPKFTVDLTVAHVGVKADIGIDFSAKRIDFKGYLKFVFYKTNYDFTILSF
jgi:two-component SAPR family response regulator